MNSFELGFEGLFEGLGFMGGLFGGIASILIGICLIVSPIGIAFLYDNNPRKKKYYTIIGSLHYALVIVVFFVVSNVYTDEYSIKGCLFEKLGLLNEYADTYLGGNVALILLATIGLSSFIYGCIASNRLEKNAKKVSKKST